MYNKQSLAILKKALDKLSEGFSNLPSFEQEISSEVEAILLQVAEKMQDNFPYHHPLYAGQMLKPPHEIARLAYMLSMGINPNNHALDGGRASSAMEKKLCRNCFNVWMERASWAFIEQRHICKS